MFRFSIAGTLALVLALGFTADGRAGIVTPAGLNPGDQFRMVFVTTTTTYATSAALSTYDAIVAGDAVSGGLGTYGSNAVTWEAIGSTEAISAVTRLPADGVPIFLPDGTEVVATGAAFWNTLNVPLLHALDEDGNGSVIVSNVHTGTYPDGTPYPGFALGDTFVVSGLSTATSFHWASDNVPAATSLLPLYGFSNILTVPEPTTAVPEPGTFAIMFVGLAGFVGSHLLGRRRREASSRPAIAS